MVRPQVVSFLDDMLKSEDNLRMEEISVPKGFAVTKNTATLFEGKAGRLMLSIEAEKGEILWNVLTCLQIFAYKNLRVFMTLLTSTG